MWHFLRELPITILRAISDLLEWLMVASWTPLVQENEGEDRSLAKTLLLLPILVPYWIFRFGIACLTFVFAAFFFPAGRRNCYLRGLPAVLIGLMIALGLALHAFYGDRILMRYVSRVQGAFRGENYEEGRKYGVRMIEDSRQDRDERTFLFALLIGLRGEKEASNSILDQLAPDDREGLADAHRARAFEIARDINTQSLDPEAIEALRWHLSHSGETNTEQMHHLWSIYYRADGQLDLAEASLREASQLNPVFSVAYSDFLMELGKKDLAERALNDAVRTFAGKLNENPLSKPIRLQLVVALNRLKRSEDAERVLVAGTQLHRDGEMRLALSDFYLMLQEQEEAEEKPLVNRLTRLIQSLRADPNSQRAYNAWIDFFASESNRSKSQELESALEGMLVDGTNVGMVHFMLGVKGLLANPGELNRVRRASADGKKTGDDESDPTEAIWHIKQAIALDSGFALICNNYAQSLLIRDPAILDAAILLAEIAVSSSPNMAPYLETLGDALTAQGNWERAATVFDQASTLDPERKSIGEKRARLGVGSRSNATN
jgi:tetratricopeptide (TPR) repeat protein